MAQFVAPPLLAADQDERKAVVQEKLYQQWRAGTMSNMTYVHHTVVATACYMLFCLAIDT